MASLGLSEDPVEQVLERCPDRVWSQYVLLALTAPSRDKMESSVDIGLASAVYGGQADDNLIVTTDNEYEEYIIADAEDVRAV